MTKKKSSAALITINRSPNGDSFFSYGSRHSRHILLGIPCKISHKVWLVDPDSYDFGGRFNHKKVCKVRVTKMFESALVEIISSNDHIVSSFYSCLKKFNVYFPLYMGHSKKKTFYLLDASKWDVEL